MFHVPVIHLTRGETESLGIGESGTHMSQVVRGGANARSNFVVHYVLYLGAGLPREPSLCCFLDPGCPLHRTGPFSSQVLNM